MTQFRFTKWQDDLTSFDEITKMAGIIKPSVYRGFDTYTFTAGLNGNITHNVTGMKRTLLNQSLSPDTGIWMTNQGVIVMEDGPIPVTLESNAGNVSARTDILVGVHYHDTLVAGGTAAYYTVVKGQTGNPSPPALTNPPLQTIIGYFTIPANAATAIGVKYERARIPGLGGKNNARTDEPNIFTDKQQFNQGNDTQITVNTTYSKPDRGTITALDKGNLFLLQGIAANGNVLDLLPNAQPGTNITIVSTVDIVLRDVKSNYDSGGKPVGWDDGYRPIFLSLAVDPENPTNDIKLTIPKGTTIEFIRFDDRTTYGQYWALSSISFASTGFGVMYEQVIENTADIETMKADIELIKSLISNVIQAGTVRWAYTDPSKVDQSTGLGKDEWIGWAWCNGIYHATPSGSFFAPNLRARGIKGWDPQSFDYDTPGKIGGSDTVQLYVPNLPAHSFQISVPNSRNAGSSQSGGYLANQENTGSSKVYYTNTLGNNTPHENRSPFLVLIPFIKLPL